jgi:hypothetical protein
LAGLLHLAQGVALFFILNEATTIPVITRFFTQTAEGIRPESEVLFNFPVAYIAPIFLLLSVAAHLFVSAPFCVRPYEKNISQGINPARW